MMALHVVLADDLVVLVGTGASRKNIRRDCNQASSRFEEKDQIQVFMPVTERLYIAKDESFFVGLSTEKWETENKFRCTSLDSFHLLDQHYDLWTPDLSSMIS